MILKVFALYDSKAAAYAQPFFLLNQGLALRGMLEALNKENEFTRYPEDFTLFELGEYDDSCGKMVPHPTPVPVVKIIELISQKQSKQNPSALSAVV